MSLRAYLLTAVIAIIASTVPERSEACVAVERPWLRAGSDARILRNSCPYTVVLNWCQGDSCRPGQPNRRLTPGRSTDLPRGGTVRWNYCEEAAYTRSNGRVCNR